MTETVLLARDAGVLTIRMNRAEKKNALDRAMYRAMAEALASAESEEAIRAVLIAGAPGAFTAGNDIADFVAFAQDGQRPSEVEAFLLALVRSSKPLVAAVDGLAIGIGTTMLMHCDLVFATPRSIFRTPFVDLGLVPEAASSLIAPRLMGPQRAFALLAAGETFDAQAACEANFVTRVVDDAEEAARLASAALAQKPPEALRISRELVRGDRSAVEERIGVEIDHFAERLTSREAQAAFAAFMARSKG